MANDKKNPDCYICGSKYVISFKYVGGFQLFKCKKCKLIWADEEVGHELEKFYDKHYFNSDSKMGYMNYLKDEENIRANGQSIINITNQIRDLTNLRVIDIGAAFGFLLDEARVMKGCEIYGVEVSDYAHDYAKNVLKINTFYRELDAPGLEPAFFDVAFLIGTIEHLKSPKETLQKINVLLKPGGLLVITTIDTAGILPLYSVKPPEHLFYFNHANLLLLLTNSGYKQLLLKTYFVSYRLDDLFHRLKEFSSLAFWGTLSKIASKILPSFSIKIPTNEMVVIVQKQ